MKVLNLADAMRESPPIYHEIYLLSDEEGQEAAPDPEAQTNPAAATYQATRLCWGVCRGSGTRRSAAAAGGAPLESWVYRWRIPVMIVRKPNFSSSRVQKSKFDNELHDDNDETNLSFWIREQRRRHFCLDDDHELLFRAGVANSFLGLWHILKRMKALLHYYNIGLNDETSDEWLTTINWHFKSNYLRLRDLTVF